MCILGQGIIAGQNTPSETEDTISHGQDLSHKHDEVQPAAGTAGILELDSEGGGRYLGPSAAPPFFEQHESVSLARRQMLHANIIVMLRTISLERFRVRREFSISRR
jgi:hypothetical protein